MGRNKPYFGNVWLAHGFVCRRTTQPAIYLQHHLSRFFIKTRIITFHKILNSIYKHRLIFTQTLYIAEITAHTACGFSKGTNEHTHLHLTFSLGCKCSLGKVHATFGFKGSEPNFIQTC